MQAIKNTSLPACDATGDAVIWYSRTHKKIFMLCIIICLTIIAKAQHTISLTFKNMVGEMQLNTDSSYINQAGEAFTVRNFRYYISNITFIDSVDNKSQLYRDVYFSVAAALCVANFVSNESNFYQLISDLLSGNLGGSHKKLPK